tara:strand:+ start:31 stop:207 length:177 start_codon:yes stop_codon:yes gene_type:complete
MHTYIVIQTNKSNNLRTIKSVFLSYSKAQIEASRLDEEQKLIGLNEFDIIIETHLITN